MIEAHAVGFIDTTRTPPVVTGVGIYSNDAGSIATDQRRAYPFDIALSIGSDFAAAQKALTEHLAKFYPWAFALLDVEYRKEVQS